MTEAQVDPESGRVARRRRDEEDVPQLVDRELAERLVAQAREAGVDLVGSGARIDPGCGSTPCRAVQTTVVGTAWTDCAHDEIR